MSTNRIKSSHRNKSQRPPKPYLTFPLTVHPSGRWCKRIRNRLHYFGYWRNADGSLKSDGGDWQTALELYKSQADDLHARRTPRTDPDSINVADLVDRFLTSKRLLLDNGELSPRTFSDYYQCCKYIISVFGKRRVLSDLRPEDFGRLRSELAKIRGRSAWRLRSAASVSCSISRGNPVLWTVQFDTVKSSRSRARRRCESIERQADVRGR